MNARELEGLLMEWDKARVILEDIETQIKDEVLIRGKTFSTHTVTASYSGGRRNFDWKGAGSQASADVIARHTVQPPLPDPVTDWKLVCKEAEIEPSFTKGAPSVRVKAVKPKE